MFEYRFDWYRFILIIIAILISTIGLDYLISIS